MLVSSEGLGARAIFFIRKLILNQFISASSVLGELHGEKHPRCSIGGLPIKRPTLTLRIHGSTALRQNVNYILFIISASSVFGEFHGESQPKCQIGGLTTKHPTLTLRIHGSTDSSCKMFYLFIFFLFDRLSLIWPIGLLPIKPKISTYPPSRCWIVLFR
jgi:hypothetical protein